MAISKTEHRYFAYIKSKKYTNYITRNYINGGDMDFWQIESNGYKNRLSALKLAKAELESGEHYGCKVGIVDVVLDYVTNEKGCNRPYRFTGHHIEIAEVA